MAASSPPDPFRDFGLLPDSGREPLGPIRSEIGAGAIVGQFIGTGLATLVGVGITVLLAMFAPTPLNVLGAAATVAGFGAFLFLVVHNDYRWVELDGRTLRAKHLYTGGVVERDVAEITRLITMVLLVRNLTVVITEKFLGRVRGIEISFRDHDTPMRIWRKDPTMTNARELIEAIIFRMSQIGEIDAEVVDFGGAPFVRHICWKGETHPPPKRKTLRVVLACLTGLTLMAGAILALWGGQEEWRFRWATTPVQQIPLRTLVAQGPGPNLHVELTDFEFGGYASEIIDARWSVWIALFPRRAADEPANQPGNRDIAVMAYVRVRNKMELDAYLRKGRVVGVCAQSQRTTFGTVVGPNLLDANPGCTLTRAWQVDELNDPPSAAFVHGLLRSAAACFSVVFLLTAGILLVRNGEVPRARG